MSPSRDEAPRPGAAPPDGAPRFGPPDATLVERARGGDRWAEEVLFRRHAPRLLELLTRLLGRVDQADDVAQEAFVLAYRDLAKLRDPTRFGPWLRRIAVHRARRHQRRNALRRKLFRSEDDLPLDRLASPDAPADARAALAAVDRTLSREKIAARTAWLLVRVEGCTLEEAADASGTSLATVKRAIARIDEKLARLPKAGSRAAPEQEATR